ncbi:hypothetical protein V8F06_009788 [Rhypophila decipiens]
MTLTEKKILHLNALDHLPPPNYAQSVIYLSLNPSISPKDAFAVLQAGLRRTFQQFPWLSGKVQPVSDNDPSSLEVRFRQPYPADNQDLPQFRFNELDDDITYEDLRESGFHPTAFPDEFLTWAPFMPDVKNGAHVFVAQANFLPGACLLTSAICHSVGDGIAVNSIVKIWAENCHLFQRELPVEALSSDLSNHYLLDQIASEAKTGHQNDSIPAETWSLLGLAPPNDTSNSQPHSNSNLNSTKPELKACLFYIPSDKVSCLRTDCQASSTEDVTLTDAISALIWRSLLRARLSAREKATATASAAAFPEHDEMARLDLPFDARTYLPETIPPSYLGNLTMIHQVHLPLSILTSPTHPLSSTAEAIRLVAGKVTTQSVLSAYNLCKTRTGSERSLTLDNLRVDGNGLIITSFAGFDSNSISFGSGQGSVFGNGGRPDAVRSLVGAISKVFRYCAILPRKSKGGVEFVATLSDDEVECLEDDDEFGRYAVFVS